MPQTCSGASFLDNVSTDGSASVSDALLNSGDMSYSDNESTGDVTSEVGSNGSFHGFETVSNDSKNQTALSDLLINSASLCVGLCRGCHFETKCEAETLIDHSQQFSEPKLAMLCTGSGSLSPISRLGPQDVVEDESVLSPDLDRSYQYLLVEWEHDWELRSIDSDLVRDDSYEPGRW